MYNAAVEEWTPDLHCTSASEISPAATWQAPFAWMSQGAGGPYDELVLEYANREMSEIEHWKEWVGDKKLGIGVIDVKSFYVESPEDVAERIRLAMQYGPAEQLMVNPDCGFFQLPRWITRLKLESMVAGAKIVRGELGQ